MTPAELAYASAAHVLAEARLRYAEAWLLFRARAGCKSDQQATHQATIETGDEMTVLTAELEIARESLNRA